jgi:nitrate reductase delta subunit
MLFPRGIVKKRWMLTGKAGRVVLPSAMAVPATAPAPSIFLKTPNKPVAAPAARKITASTPFLRAITMKVLRLNAALAVAGVVVAAVDAEDREIMRTLKVLGFLLSYPTALHQEVGTDCIEILQQEKGIKDKSLQDIAALLAHLKAGDLLDLQEDYVDLFDRTPSLSLHLFEHVHGDAKERGQALADLLARYQTLGYSINNEEMPDFLPLFLEFLSVLKPEETYDYLDGVVTILAAIRARLEKRDSPYASIFQALEGLASRKPDMIRMEQALKEHSGAPQDTWQLDATWQEQFAFDPAGLTDQICPKASAMLARMEEVKTERKVVS